MFYGFQTASLFAFPARRFIRRLLRAGAGWRGRSRPRSPPARPAS
nr:MAG TPA: hypothetical protein [Caudoviricetes sp.]